METETSARSGQVKYLYLVYVQAGPDWAAPYAGFPYYRPFADSDDALAYAEDVALAHPNAYIYVQVERDS